MISCSQFAASDLSHYDIICIASSAPDWHSVGRSDCRWYDSWEFASHSGFCTEWKTAKALLSSR